MTLSLQVCEQAEGVNLYLSQFELLTTDRVACQQHKFVSHCSGGGNVKMELLVDSVSGEGPPPGCRMMTSCILHNRKRARELSGVSFLRALISLLRVALS